MAYLLGPGKNGGPLTTCRTRYSGPPGGAERQGKDARTCGEDVEGPPGSPGGSGDRGVGSERGDFCEHGSWTEEAREEAGLGRRKRPRALQDERGPLLKDSSR